MSALSLPVRTRFDIPSATTLPERLGAGCRVVLRRTRARVFLDGRTDAFLGRAALSAVVGASLAPSLLPGRPLGLRVLGALLAVLATTHAEQARARRLAAAVLPELPAVLDRLVMCTLSGLSVDRALRVVAVGAPPPLDAAMGSAIAALDAGGTRATAYRRMAAALGSDELWTLASSLERSEQLGVSAADTLVVQAREVRSRARAAAETQIAAAPVKLVFPLVFCFLPAFVVLAVGPVALSAIRTLTAL